jgi:hypothetical protein
VFDTNASGVATFDVDAVCAGAPWPAPAALRAAALAAVTDPFALDEPGKVVAAAGPLGAFAFTAASPCARCVARIDAKLTTLPVEGVVAAPAWPDPAWPDPAWAAAAWAAPAWATGLGAVAADKAIG